jgi:predicted flap endonuclease-1-like 5' DNA nuclease
MLNPADIVEIAALLLAAYIGGCSLGYCLRRLTVALRTPRPTKAPQAAPARIVSPPQLRPTPAARLAMAATPEEVAPIVAATVPAKAPPTPRDPRPKSLPAPRGGLKDDLRQIKGIGPKIEVMLHEMGVFHYDQIAAWTRSNAEWVDLKLGFKGRVAREQWIAQAKSLAKPVTKAPRKVA